MTFVLSAAESVTGEVAIALIPTLAAVLVAGLIGHRLSYVWDERRRQREGDLAARRSFYTTYGEFFATWKLWDAHKRHGATVASPSEVQWRLLERAEMSEGAFESLLVHLASERRLNDRDLCLLRCFREGYQMLREQIRADQPLGWFATSREPVEVAQYTAFRGLAAYVAQKLEETPDRRRAAPGEAEAVHALLVITSSQDLRGSWWKLAKDSLRLTDLARSRPAAGVGLA